MPRILTWPDCTRTVACVASGASSAASPRDISDARAQRMSARANPRTAFAYSAGQTGGDQPSHSRIRLILSDVFELRNGGQMIQRRFLPWGTRAAHAKGSTRRRGFASAKSLARLAGVAGVLVVLSLSLTARTASAASFVVKPPSLQGWDQQNYDDTASANTTSTTMSGSFTDFVTGPGTPPFGTGSLHQHIGTNGDDGVRVRTSAYNATPLSSLTSLSYSTYVATYIDGQAPYMVLLISYTGGPTQDALFFEPTYQTGTYSGDTVPDQCPGNE